MLEITDITKQYSTDVVETLALNKISLSVAAGDYVSIIGPSGSGKTTFLSVLGLLDSYDSGTYLFDGIDTSQLSDSELSHIRCTRLGFVFQTFNLIPELSVFRNVELPLIYQGNSAAHRRDQVMAILKELGLENRMSHLPGQLSGGQQQRVAIARAMVTEPSLILADEPTGNLDTEMGLEVINILEDLNKKGTTLIMVTHDKAMAARAKKSVKLLDGQLVSID